MPWTDADRQKYKATHKAEIKTYNRKYRAANREMRRKQLNEYRAIH